MIRNNGVSEVEPKRTVSLSGLSTDTKPTGTAATQMNLSGGSSFLELDTGKVFFYDEANDLWLQWQ